MKYWKESILLGLFYGFLAWLTYIGTTRLFGLFYKNIQQAEKRTEKFKKAY